MRKPERKPSLTPRRLQGLLYATTIAMVELVHDRDRAVTRMVDPAKAEAIRAADEWVKAMLVWKARKD